MCSEVSLAELRAAVEELDPSKPPRELLPLLGWAFSLTPEEVAEGREGEGATMELQLVLQKLGAGDTTRSGPKP